MRFIILLFIVYYIISCNNPVKIELSPDKNILTNYFKNHLAEDNLSGSIASVTYTSCNPDGDSCCLTSKVTYNSSGNRIKEIIYNCPDPNSITIGAWYWFDYYYDSLGRLSRYIRMDDETTKVFEFINVYDTTDLPSQRYYINHWIELDSTIQILSYDSLNRWTGYVEHTIERWGVNEAVSCSLIITFDESAHSIISEWQEGGSTYRRQKIVYNEKQLPVEFCVTLNTGTVLAHDFYEYEAFDDNGNWIARILTDNNKAGKIEKREIEYY